MKPFTPLIIELCKAVVKDKNDKCSRFALHDALIEFDINFSVKNKWLMNDLIGNWQVYVRGFCDLVVIGDWNHIREDGNIVLKSYKDWKARE